jgi:uncharacterized protein (DUF305 family)
MRAKELLTMNSKRSLVRRTVAVATAGAAAVVLAACGGNGDSTADTAVGHGGHTTTSPSVSASASQGQHNAADVTFAQAMIPHHRQAVEMADLAFTRAQSVQVKTLAEEIKKAQAPEIEALSGWLTSWGEEVPAEEAMDHSMHGMDGMMTAEEMDRLEKSSGEAFDTAFLKMMIKHHEGAVAMAKSEQADGSYEPAKKMADAIVTSQTAEITRMNNLLGKDWSGCGCGPAWRAPAPGRSPPWSGTPSWRKSARRRRRRPPTTPRREPWWPSWASPSSGAGSAARPEAPTASPARPLSRN